VATPRINAHDPLLLELVNRPPFDPAAEAARQGIALNEGLAPETLTATPRAPLAWNAKPGMASTRLRPASSTTEACS
jgi:hypothetical protein